MCILCKVCMVLTRQMIWNSLAGICSFEIGINWLCECYSNGQCILGSQCHWTGPTRCPYEGKDKEKERQKEKRKKTIKTDIQVGIKNNQGVLRNVIQLRKFKPWETLTGRQEKGKDIIRTISAMHPHQPQCTRHTIVSFTTRIIYISFRLVKCTEDQMVSHRMGVGVSLANGPMQLVDPGQMIIFELVS